MITLLSNPGHPPRRRVKVNGTMSDPFTINCGVPQATRVPLLSLSIFLIIAEALTRLVKLSPTFTGIKIGDTEHRISQFADDTQLYLKNFSSLSHICAILALYERATGMRANPNKFVGILCGILKGDTPPNNLGAMADLIHWLKEDEFTKIPGIPFWMQGDEIHFGKRCT
jgi:hypothetical protein